jgi:WD40 repeat protein
MSEAPSSDPDSLPVAAQLHMNAVCDRFEAAWRDGVRPRVRDFLGEVKGRERKALLRELVLLDVHYRRRRGEQCRPEDYRAFLPALDAAWLARVLAAPPPQAEVGTLADAGSRRQTAKLKPPGARLPSFGDYALLGEVGRGGMGVVYKAHQSSLDRIVAIKMVLAGKHAGPEELARFRREAAALARLQHPNIVQIHEVGTHDGRPYFSMEFVGGGSLAQRQGGEPLPPREAARLTETLARAVQAAHAAGIVHRDLKPANVLLAADGTPKISDFGLAKRLDVPAGATQTGAVVGTPSYMAPEQADGRGKDIGPAADVYALGATLYELLTGRPPFRAETPLDTVLQVIGDEPVPPRQLQSKTPPDLERVCLKCLEKDPGKRYRSALALAEDLERFQRGEPVRARALGRLARTWRWCRRNPVVAALLVAVLLGAALATGFAVQAILQARELAIAAREADAARDRAEAQLAREDVQAYAGQLAEAQREWEDKNPRRAFDLLNACDWSLRGWEHRYLYTLFTTRNRLTLVWDIEGVTSVCFSPKAARLACGGWKEVEVWDMEGKKVLSLKGHANRVNSVCFSPDGTRLASASNDGTVKVWNAWFGQELLSLNGHAGAVRSVAYSPDGQRLASAGDDKTVRVWDAHSGEQQLSLTGHAYAATSVCFSPDGQRLASAGGGVKVWDVHGGQELLALDAPTSDCRTVCFSRDGKRLASGSGNGMVKLWDADRGQEILTLRGHTGRVTSVCFSPDGQRLASAGASDGKQAGQVMVWDPEHGVAVLTLKRHQSFGSLCFSPDGQHLAYAEDHKAVTVWSGERASVVQILKGDIGAGSLCFSPDGQRLASASASAGSGGTVWDVKHGQALFTPWGHTDQVLSVCFSPDGKRLATGSKDQTVKIWDAAQGQVIFTLGGNAGAIRSVCFSPDGKRLASGGLPVRLWDTERGQELLVLDGHSQPVNSVCFSPDGKRLATASDDKTVKVWDAKRGQQHLTLTGHSEKVTSICFSPDGKRLASASSDGTVLLWNMEHGQEPVTLKPAPKITSVCFSPDGKRLACDCEEPVAHIGPYVKLWDVERGKEILTLHDESSVCFSPDGKRLATVGWYNTSRPIVRVDPTEELPAQCIQILDLAEAESGARADGDRR